MSKIKWNDDTTYGLFICRIITWPTGTWPLEERVVYARIRSAVTIIALLFLVIVLLTEICQGHTNSEENIDCLTLIICCVNGGVKVFSFNVYSEKLFCVYQAAIKDYATIDTMRNRHTVRRHAFMARIMGCVMVGVAYISSAAFVFAFYFSDATDAQNVNATDDRFAKFPIPTACISSLLTITPITYGIICGIEFLLLAIISTANLGSDWFFLSTVLHVCGQIQILKLDMADSDLEHDKAENTLRMFASRHCDLVILAGLLVDTMNAALILQVFVSCIAICVMGLQCIVSLNIGANYTLCKSAMVLATLLMQMFSYCYVSDYLKTQTGDVGISIYGTAWHSLPSNLMKNVVFIIMRAQESIQLTAAGFIPLNMETYMSILKTSFSYLSVLRIVLNS